MHVLTLLELQGPLQGGPAPISTHTPATQFLDPSFAQSASLLAGALPASEPTCPQCRSLQPGPSSVKAHISFPIERVLGFSLRWWLALPLWGYVLVEKSTALLPRGLWIFSGGTVP